MYFISQIGEHDCGFACLNMMLANYHHDKNYLFLKHEDQQYSFKELVDTAKEHNLSLIGVKIKDPYDLTTYEHFPIIAVLQLDNGAHHSVYLVKATSKKVTYYDPAIGKVTESFVNFVSKWTKSALIIENGVKTTCDIKPDSFVAKRDKITLPIFQILSGASFLFATYFIDRDVSMLFPIIAFVLFFVFELLFRDNLIRAMRRMDNNIERYEIDIPKEKYHDLFVATEKYRIRALTRAPDIINACLISMFLVFILLINDINNYVYVLLTMFLTIIECFILNPFLKKKSVEVDEQERSLLKVDNANEYQILSRATRESAYKVAMYQTVFNYVSIGIMLFASIIIMAMANVVNLTYVVFYLCVCLFLRMNIKKVFSFDEITQEKDKELAKIICFLK